MVAIFTGAGTGFERGSGNVLGAAGLWGSAAHGRSGQQLLVNAATGNLMVQRQDTMLVGVGPDAALQHSYNSLGARDDMGGDNWRVGGERRLDISTRLLGYVTLHTDDGSAIRFDETGVGSDVFRTTEGAGSYDTITRDGADWTFRDGDSGTTEEYGHGSLGERRITRRTDRSGNSIDFAWTSNSLLQSITTSGGGSITYGYAANSANATTATVSFADPLNGAPRSHVYRYSYDANDRLSGTTIDLTPEDGSIADGKLYAVSYHYNDAGLISEITETDGSRLTIAYDSSGRVTSVSQYMGTTAPMSAAVRVTALSYEDGVTRITDPVNLVTELRYNADGSLASVTVPPGGEWAQGPQVTSFTYTANGDVASTTDPLGRTTSFTFDGNGNSLTGTDRLGNVVTRTFDADNRLRTETRTGSDRGSAAALHTDRYVYDQLGRLRFTISAEGNVTEQIYDARGQVEWSRTYTADRYPIAGLSSSSAPTEAQVQAWAGSLPNTGQLRATHFGYDVRGNLRHQADYSIFDGFGLTIFHYDQAGRLLRRMRTGENTENFVYDGMGRLISSTDLNGGTTSIVFDDAATRTVVTLANGLTQTSVYDLAGGLVSYTETGAFVPVGTVSYLNDSLGRPRRTTDANGIKSYQIWDRAGRKVADISQTGEMIEYRYDMNDRLVATARYARLVDPVYFIGLDYPDTNYIAGWVRPQYDPADLWTWQIYDAEDRVIQTIDSAGSVVDYAYDASGRQVSTIEYANRASATTLYPFPYVFPTTPVTVAANAADRVTRTFYDADGRVVGALDGEGYLSSNSYDGAGALIAETRFGIRVPGGDSNLRETGTFEQLLQATAVILGPFQDSATAQSRTTRYVYDGQGFLRFEIDTLGRVVEYDYNTTMMGTAHGRVRKATAHATALSPLTNYTVHTVHVALTAAGADDNPQNRISFSVYDAADREAYAIGPDGVVEAYRYDTMGQRVATIGFATRRPTIDLPTKAEMDDWATNNTAPAQDRVTRFYFAANGDLRFAVDAEGYVTRNDYDAGGRLVAELRFAAKAIVDDTTTIGALSAMASGAYVARTYAYDAMDRRVASSDGNGTPTSYAYSATGLLVAEIVSLGTADEARTTYSHDGAGRVVQRIDGQGTAEQATSSFAYNAFGELVSSVDARGSVTSYSLDEIGRTVAVTDAAGTTSFQYNAFGEQTAVTDARGVTTFNHYDSVGRRIAVLDGESYVTRFAYNRFDDLVSTTRYAGRYMPGGPLGGVEFGWGGNVPPVGGLPASVTSFAYDKLGRVIATTDAEGHTELTGYDAFGNVTSVQNKLDGITSYGYDRRGLRLTEYVDAPVFDAHGTQTAAGYFRHVYSYDARGNRLSDVEALGLAEQRTTSFGYDAADRLVSRSGDVVAVGAPGAVQDIAPTETYGYDARGNVVLTTDATGQRIQSYYDDLNRMVARVRSSGGPAATQGFLETYTYDANGNLLATRSYEHAIALPPVGGPPPAAPTTGGYRETSNAYDALNRRVSTAMLPTTKGAWNGTDYAMVVGASLSTTEYDANGNVVRETDANGASTITWYDRLNRAVARVDAERYLTSWTRDAEGNVTTEHRWATQVPTIALAAGGQPTVAASPADRITSFTYDRNGRRLTETRHAVEAWSVDPTTGALAAATGPATVTYVYNGLGEVTRRTEATGDHVEYSYDTSGRLVHEARPGFLDQTGTAVRPSVDYLYNGLGDLTRTVESGARITRYTYGAGGRLLSSVDAAGGAKGFFYDAAGRKLAESYDRIDSAGTVRQEATLFAYDDAGQMVAQGHMAFHPGQGWVAEGDQTSMHYNAWGDVVARAVNGVVQERFDYDAAGRVWRTNSDDGVYRVYLYDAVGNRTLAIESAGDDLSALTLEQVLALASDDGAVPVGRSERPGIRTTITAFDGRKASVATIAPKRHLEGGVLIDLVDGRSYNAFGEQLSETDVYGNVTTFAYNSIGRRTLVTLPIVGVTDEAGVTTQAAPTQRSYYDISGRLIATQDANGNTITRSLLAGTGYGSGEEADEPLVLAEFKPDGGVMRNAYDVFGDMRLVRNEVGLETSMAYDGLGRLVQTVRSDGLVDDYAYDVLGQRIAHMSSAYLVAATGLPDRETTDYDSQGRVIATRLFGGDTTTTSYVWDATLTVAGLNTVGGHRETTTFANGRTLVEVTDGFDHRITRTDLGGRVFTYGYDAGGQLLSEGTAGETRSYTYYRTGLASGVTLVRTGTPPVDQEQLDVIYDYDRRGLKTRERTIRTTTTGGTPATEQLQDATATYDALGRMATWTDIVDRDATIDTAPNSIAQLYDAAGNIRRTQVTYNNVDDQGNFVAGGVQDQWFRYDAMNRVVVAKGALVSGQIVRGDAGTDITYDAAGRRATATMTVAGTVRRETYGYDEAVGQIASVVVETQGADGSWSPLTSSVFEYDAAGRMLRQQDSDATGVVYERTVSYTGRSQVASENVVVRRGTDTIATATTISYGESAAYALGAPVLATSTTTTNGQNAVTADTAYTYEYFDGPVQASITYRPNVEGPVTNQTTQSYTPFGVLASSVVADARPRTVTYVSNAMGQVIRRSESDNDPNTGDPYEVWFRFDGRELGRVGNNGTLETDYASSVADRGTEPTTGPGAGNFRNGSATGVQVAEWGSGYDPVTSYRQGSEGGTYTVQTGDTLQSVAERVYGDRSLWYRIAQANGLGLDTQLVEGQILTLPRGVIRTANSSSTFRPYDPGAVVGDIFPDEVDTSATQPQPQVRRRRNRCGIFGAILLAVVAVAVTAVTGGALIPALGPVAGGALAGAAGSVASQVVGVATGIQDRFSFRGVALAALAGGVAGGVGQALGTGSIGGSQFLGDVARGAAGSAITQGVALVTGLQSRFDFVGVAAAGLGAGAGGAAGSALRQSGTGSFAARLGSSAASGLAIAASQSLVDGTSFGDNLVGALPQIIGQTVGGVIADRLARRPAGNQTPTNRNMGGSASAQNGVATAMSQVPGELGDITVVAPSRTVSDAQIAAAAAAASQEERAGRGRRQDMAMGPPLVTLDTVFTRLTDLDIARRQVIRDNDEQISRTGSGFGNIEELLQRFDDEQARLISLNNQADRIVSEIIRPVLPTLDTALSIKSILGREGSAGDYVNVASVLLPGAGSLAGRVLTVSARGILNSASSRVLVNFARGRNFEASAILDVFSPLGITRNTQVFSEILPNGRIINTVPDIVSRRVGVVEFKDVTRLSSSNQLRAQLQLADRLGIPYNLVVSTNTRSISRPLQNQIASVTNRVGGGIYRYDASLNTLVPF